MSASIKSVVSSTSESKEILYDDSITQLGANNLQDAIVKIVERLNGIETNIGGNTEKLSKINNSLKSTIGVLK